eukprot:GEMP01010272.1.p1 GENE.GEMP01010272.1~~GEMP01010272.1.p1  ORF type:complete len:859 (+),score=185.84 GEMP01010272.1:231-2807(+)
MAFVRIREELVAQGYFKNENHFLFFALKGSTCSGKESVRIIRDALETNLHVKLQNKDAVVVLIAGNSCDVPDDHFLRRGSLHFHQLDLPECDERMVVARSQNGLSWEAGAFSSYNTLRHIPPRSTRPRRALDALRCVETDIALTPIPFAGAEGHVAPLDVVRAHVLSLTGIAESPQRIFGLDHSGLLDDVSMFPLNVVVDDACRRTQVPGKYANDPNAARFSGSSETTKGTLGGACATVDTGDVYALEVPRDRPDNAAVCGLRYEEPFPAGTSFEGKLIGSGEVMALAPDVRQHGVVMWPAMAELAEVRVVFKAKGRVRCGLLLDVIETTKEIFVLDRFSPEDEQDLLPPVTRKPQKCPIQNDTVTRIWNQQLTTRLYEVYEFKRSCLALVPVQRLYKQAQQKLNGRQMDEVFIREVLNWFKTEFFSWMDAPACPRCPSKTAVVHLTVESPSEKSEEYYWDAHRIETVACRGCGDVLRFPRYNHPLKLLESRSGRCGEWANCFTGICRALGYETRYVLDFSDHVWTECWIPSFKRWVHLDPCENAFDKPLLYSKGWGKKLTLVLALAKDHCMGVTRRYTGGSLQGNFKGMEHYIDMISLRLSAIFLNNCTLPQHRHKRKEIIAQRRFDEMQEMERESGAQGNENLPGRTTGDVAWRAQRGELGTAGAACAAETSNQAVHTETPAGGTHGDTVPFTFVPPLGTRIVRVRVWGGHYVGGFQLYVEDPSGAVIPSPVYGNREEEGPIRTLEMNATEHICKVEGRAGALVDQIRFVTNRDRSVAAGDSTGGDAFVYQGNVDKGERLCSVAGGYGGHLHNVHAFYAPSDPRQELRDIFDFFVKSGEPANEAGLKALAILKKRT